MRSSKNISQLTRSQTIFCSIKCSPAATDGSRVSVILIVATSVHQSCKRLIVRSDPNPHRNRESEIRKKKNRKNEES